jgi:dTDP-glucose 4,6-dehydratase
VLRAGASGEIYNIGAGNEITNRELTSRLLALCDASDNHIEYVTDRLGHDRRYSIDTAKVGALGWAPAHSLDEALAATVDSYRSNRWWWEPLRRRLP